eukprot:Opistho-1_new@27532
MRATLYPRPQPAQALAFAATMRQPGAPCPLPQRTFLTHLPPMSAATSSLWSPLRQPAFRGLWLAGGVFFIGSGMQTMAAAWLMVELSGSSFLAALVQTAVFMPMYSALI